VFAEVAGSTSSEKERAAGSGDQEAARWIELFQALGRQLSMRLG
jgi:hypothetical protein